MSNPQYKSFGCLIWFALILTVIIFTECVNKDNSDKITKTQIISGKDTLFINQTFGMYVKASGHGHNDFKTGTETFTFDTPKDTVFIHDTLKVIPNEKELQETLLMYYKAGWIEAINSNIDLYNSGEFTSDKVYSARDKHWRKMENEVRNK